VARVDPGDVQPAITKGKGNDEMDETSIYSCDDHLDLRSVPRDLWQSRLSKDLVERGPKVVTGKGDPKWVCNDRVLGRSGIPKGDKLQVLSAVSRAGLEDDGFRVSDPKLRLEDMDLDGVWASVIYGPIPLTLSIPEPDLQTACYAAWNDWALEEFNAYAPDRLCALPFLPSHSPEAAVAELERVAGLGHRGAIIDVFDFDAGDPAWDRLWAAAEHTRLPLSFHIKEGASPRLSYQVGKWQSAAFASLLPLQLDEALAIMVFSAALERHPGLTLVLAEAGVGWLPYFLNRMDMEWENLRDKIDDAPTVAPSDLFRRQVMATFEEEEMAYQYIPLLGADSCMWAADFPHTDSTFPESRRSIAETLGTLPEGDRRKITALNCARLYGFEYVG
jgi:predicted TIM-barrel fold metal-dependent hydrolase